jgi:aminopeptidase
MGEFDVAAKLPAHFLHADMDPRFTQLAEVLTGFSTNLKKGEKVLIDVADIPDEMTVALIRAARAKGAEVQTTVAHSRINREILRAGSDAQFAMTNEFELARMKKMDAYIAVRGSNNIFESSDVPADRMNAYAKAIRPTMNQRVEKSKWVVLRWPTASMAQQAKMSTEAFEDFYFRVCTMDYSRMVPGMKALQDAMQATDRVHIKGPGTDLKFSIKNIAAVPCGGEYNIPDGEVFTAPVKDSVEGVIQYNAPTIYQGVSFDNIRLVFKKGKIVEATSNNTKRLNEILDTDPGARYIGEFALGFHPHILNPMQDILFDEKIAGSFHFTPGKCYEKTDNGNKSAVHWDMVCIQRPEYGGGEIFFDDKLIRKDGLFVPKALHKLNPEYLLGKGK